MTGPSPSLAAEPRPAACGSEARDPSAVAFAARSLGFRYPGGRVALRDLDLTCPEGVVLGLMGPNGSGKSTLLRLLATALAPGSGELRVLPGRSRETDAERRRRIAAVFDRNPFLPHLSGRENLHHLLGLRGLPRRERRECAVEWLDRFQLADRADDPVATYSFGMRRKLGLAEALAGPAELLLLDEAVGGLDPRGRHALARVLASAAAAGRTVVLAGHEHRYLATVCGRVAMLHEGRVVAEGAPADLVARLGGETVLEVSVGDRGGRTSPDPPGLEELGLRPLTSEGRAGRQDATLRFASTRGARPLPDLCARLLEAGISIRDIRVREPDLEDVFLSLAGQPLTSRTGAAS